MRGWALPWNFEIFPRKNLILGNFWATWDENVGVRGEAMGRKCWCAGGGHGTEMLVPPPPPPAAAAAAEPAAEAAVAAAEAPEAGGRNGAAGGRGGRSIVRT